MESSSSEPIISVDAAGQTEITEPDAIDLDTNVIDIARTDAEDIALAPPLRADSRLDDAATAFDEFMLRKGFSENTIRAFRNDLKITVGFLSAETPLYQIRTEHLEEYLTWLQGERGKPCSAKTLARRITTLKVFFGWIHGIGVLGTDPAEPIVQQVARTPLPNILTYDESSRLHARCAGLSHEPRPGGCTALCIGVIAVADRHEESRVCAPAGDRCQRGASAVARG